MLFDKYINSPNSIINIINSAVFKKIRNNYFYLVVLLGLNYLIQLITLPYLIRILGVGKYGQIAFAQSILGYFVVGVNYGFNLTATREIAINRNNKDKVQKIFSTIIIIKFAFSIISFIIYFACVLLIKRFHPDRIFFILMFYIVIWEAIFPIWFFQGVENMKYITIISFVSKVITIILMILFINDPADFIKYPIINIAGNIIAGVYIVRIIKKQFSIKIVCPNINEIIEQLKNGWHIFISTAAVSLYTTSNIFILGILKDEVSVGYYAGPEKIIKALINLIYPAINAIYPYSNRIFSESRNRGIKFTKKILIIFGIFGGMISLISLLLCKPIIIFIYGEYVLSAMKILKTLIVIPFILSVSMVLGVILLINLEYKAKYSKIIITAGISNIIISITTIKIIGDIGVAISWTITEIYIAIAMIYFVYKNKLIKNQ